MENLLSLLKHLSEGLGLSAHEVNDLLYASLTQNSTTLKQFKQINNKMIQSIIEYGEKLSKLSEEKQNLRVEREKSKQNYIRESQALENLKEEIENLKSKKNNLEKQYQKLQNEKKKLVKDVEILEYDIRIKESKSDSSNVKTEILLTIVAIIGVVFAILYQIFLKK